MHGDCKELSANDVDKLSFGRTSYSEVDELGHTYVCSGLNFGPCSLVVARTQGVQTEDAQGRLKLAVVGSSTFSRRL
jgi:hypothetical protein